MLNIRFPLPVKFICGFIYSDKNIYKKTLNILRAKFGEIDFESQAIDFNFTDYYYQEMGKPLWRNFIAFKKLVKPDKFAAIKLYCIKLEKKFSYNDKRIINIDPGYINEAKLVLTTTKDFSHRIYLQKGIFAEVTLLFQNGKFNDFPTTFPDYKTENYKKILMQIRDIYRSQLVSFR